MPTMTTTTNNEQKKAIKTILLMWISAFLNDLHAKQIHTYTQTAFSPSNIQLYSLENALNRIYTFYLLIRFWFVY